MTIPGGYSFRPSRYSPPIGHAGLDIELIEAHAHRSDCICSATFLAAGSRPTERTFHPISDEAGEDEAVHICAGSFRLRAANGDVVYGYSFGGRLAVHPEPACTHCALESPAPMFDLAFGPASTRVFLYSEVMALLARQRAKWANDADFCRRLVTAEPFALYVAIMTYLESYLRRFTGSPWAGEYRKGDKAVRRSIATLRAAGDWPLMPPRLEELL